MQGYAGSGKGKAAVAAAVAAAEEDDDAGFFDKVRGRCYLSRLTHA